MNVKQIIISQKEERDILLTRDYIPRESLTSARNSLKNDLIKVIVGPRRAGKSVFALQMLKDFNFAYLNFDDERLLAIRDYDEILKALKEVYGEAPYLLLDEIQNLEAWELWVSRLQRRGFKVVITGSNSRLLSRELATHLTGRYQSFSLYPFSFREFLTARNFNFDLSMHSRETLGTLLNYLHNYLEIGGYPEVVLGKVDPRGYLRTLVDSVLFKDIVRRYNLRFAKKLSDLALYLLSNASGRFSYTKLKNILSFRSVHTVENYVKYLEEAFVIFVVERFSPKLKERFKSPRKVYAYDTGVVATFKSRLAADYRILMENLVAIELLRRGKEFFYFQAKDGREVDFVMKEGLDSYQLIQVSYDLSDEITRKREFSALIKASRELGVKDLWILSWEDEGKTTYKGLQILVYPLWKWLLQGPISELMP
ncbi:ATP-binding protein [Thermodesulfatator autotrophicus]|nr:ATP-binding protein [Thermodesulfatator autotrophicus]